ncbi:MAG: GNAT family N-acetyltransferase [Anaerolineaceae bacterium]|jgi:ribosomal protein S18 acetylase RimI-like enzyme
MEFRELDESWKDKTFLFRYTTTHHYRVEIKDDDNEITLKLRREESPEPVIKSFESALYSDWLENPWVLGVFEGEELIAFIETSDESWNNRLRIANLWVNESHRYRGIGKLLIARAIERAKNTGQRAIVLETQSCNDPAIRFYRTCGFKLIGLDANHYQNDDIERGEVRLEFGLVL